ncbi:hypothetical protein [Candidatus Villigracilis proximus]|uniref:hypothetical protein n=1 Tax=Candidatus Villigracilis proximus TaxID=3140683 RepID=UPI0031E5B693
MKTPRIFYFLPDPKNIFHSILSQMESFFSRTLKKNSRKAKRLSVISISILSLVACQPSLWGAPPPPPTVVVATASATFQAPIIPTLAPTITPMPPTTVPTPVVLNAAQIWASPATPALLREMIQRWGFQVLAADQSSANLYIDIAQPAQGAMHVSTWTYALVAPFPTLTDNISTQELLSSWGGSNFGPFAGVPLMMEESTLMTFTALWGLPHQARCRLFPPINCWILHGVKCRPGPSSHLTRSSQNGKY